MKRRFLATLLISVMSMSFAACSGGNEEATVTGESKDKTLNITLINQGAGQPYVAAYKDAFDEVEEEFNVKINLVDGGYDINQQVNGMQNAIAYGVDGIVVAPLDPVAIEESVNAALDAGIPVCALTVQIGTGPAENPVYPGTAGFVGHVESKVGETSLELAAQALDGIGKIALIEGTPGASDAELRTEGIMNKIKEYPDMEIVTTVVGDWVVDKAYTAMQNIIQSNPDIEAVICHSDNMAVGAATALADADLTGEVKVIGIGGSKDALAMIETGEIYGTIMYMPKTEAYTALKAVIELARGEGETEVFYNVQDLPIFEATGGDICTQENVSKFTAEW